MTGLVGGLARLPRTLSPAPCRSPLFRRRYEAHVGRCGRRSRRPRRAAADLDRAAHTDLLSGSACAFSGGHGPLDVEAVEIPSAGGVTLQGWFLPSRVQPPSPVVIVFNGNAGNRAYRSRLGAALRSQGLSVLLFDYRGFGDSSGSPAEGGLYDDARAVRRYLEGRSDVRADRLVYFGESLGTAVAVRLAVEHPPAALILRSPFTSMVDVGRLHYPILPVRWLLRDRFSSIDAIGGVRSPVLVVAGDRDRIVPLEQSRQLFEKRAAAA